MSLFGLGGGLSLDIFGFGASRGLDGLAAAAAAAAAGDAGSRTPARAGRRSSDGDLVLVFDPDADNSDGSDDGDSAAGDAGAGRASAASDDDDDDDDASSVGSAGAGGAPKKRRVSGAGGNFACGCGCGARATRRFSAKDSKRRLQCFVLQVEYNAVTAGSRISSSHFDGINVAFRWNQDNPPTYRPCTVNAADGSTILSPRVAQPRDERASAAVADIARLLFRHIIPRTS